MKANIIAAVAALAVISSVVAFNKYVDEQNNIIAIRWTQAVSVECFGKNCYHPVVTGNWFHRNGRY